MRIGFIIDSQVLPRHVFDLVQRCSVEKLFENTFFISIKFVNSEENSTSIRSRSRAHSMAQTVAYKIRQTFVFLESIFLKIATPASQFLSLRDCSDIDIPVIEIVLKPARRGTLHTCTSPSFSVLEAFEFDILVN